MLNSPKGEAIFNEISEQLVIKKKDWNDAYASNQSFIHPWKEPELYKEFWMDYQKMTFYDIMTKYYTYDKTIEEKKMAEANSRSQAYKNMPKVMKYYLRKIKNRIGFKK